MAFKSDVTAKQEFINKLLREGYDSAEVKARPADIVAQKDGETWYFEIKLTDHSDKCFGAATLTEWEQAMKTPEHYRFVIAIRHEDGTFEFRQYTPEEFMRFSTIPPFKVYFNISLDGKQKRRGQKNSSPAIRLREKSLQQMIQLYKDLRNEEERVRRAFANAFSNIQLAIDPDM